MHHDLVVEIDREAKCLKSSQKKTPLLQDLTQSELLIQIDNLTDPDSLELSACRGFATYQIFATTLTTLLIRASTAELCACPTSET